MATVAPTRKRRSSSERMILGPRLRIEGMLRFVYIGLFLLFLLGPLYWVFVTSIKPVEDFQAVPPVWFPAEPTLRHYTDALTQFRGWTGLKNSVIVAGFATLASVFVGTLAAYSMARFHTGGKHLAFWVLSQRIMPPIAVVIPIFLIYRSLGIIDTRLGLIVLYTVFTLPFSIWMMYTYFRQMPVELEEAALVDGCTRFQALSKIAWPLAAPGIVSAAAFAFIFSWTEFLLALVLTSSQAVTVPVVIAQFLSFQTAQFGASSALSVCAMVPAFFLGWLIQRHLVRGLTMGAVQG
jgi:multiple sugar transport system permease protein